MTPVEAMPALGDTATCDSPLVEHDKAPISQLKLPQSELPQSRRRDLLVTALVAGVALVCYRLLAQQGLHFLDSRYLLFKVSTFATNHPWHAFALRPFVWVHEILAPLGCSAVDSCRWATALGGALLVAFSHRTAVTLALPRSQCVAVAVLVGCTPAVAYFATIIEFQAMAMAGAGAAVWTFVVLGRSNSTACALALGGITAIAAAAHSVCHLLGGLWPLLAFSNLWPRYSRRRVALLCTVAAATQAVVFGSMLMIIGGSAVSDHAAAELLTGAITHTHITSYGDRIWSEFLLPFAPMSLLLVSASLRLFGKAWPLLVSTAIGCTVCHMLLAPIGTAERGAYLLVLAIPFAVFAITTLPSRCWPLLLAVAIGLAGWLRHEQATMRPCDPTIAAGASNLERQQPRTFVSGSIDVLDAFAVHAPGLQILDVSELTSPTSPEAHVTIAMFDRLLRATAPRQIVIDEQTWVDWRTNDSVELQYLSTQHIPAKYRVEVVISGNYRGVAIACQ